MVTTLAGMGERALTMVDAMNQLRAEIGDVFKGNESAFAREAGINRTQLLKYLSGDRDMGLDRLMRCVAVVGLTPEEFFARARRRAEAAEPVPPTDVPWQPTRPELQ